MSGGADQGLVDQHPRDILRVNFLQPERESIMDALRRQVAIAYRRLLLHRFFGVLAWCWFGTLLVAAIAIGAVKFMPTGFDTLVWSVAWLGGAIVAGLLIAIAWTYATRLSPLEAAIEIDRRFGLKERVSSTLAMDQAELESEAGRALIRDTKRRIERLDIGTQFGVRLQRRALLPLLPGALALGLLFVTDPTREEEATARQQELEAKQIKESAEPLRKKFEQQKKELAEKGLKDAAELFKQLEEGTRELTKRDNVDRKQALSKFNDLQKQLEERREKLGGAQKMKEQLEKLKNLKAGPADKVADAIKNGDFKKAVDEIEKLQQQLDKGDLDEKKKEELREQLADMQKQLQKAAEAQKDAEKKLEKQIAELQKQIPDGDQLKKQIDELIKAGRKEDAEKLKQQAEQMARQMDQLQQQLAKMQQAGPQMQQMQEMAKQLGQCAQCMKNGDNQGAQQALNQLKDGMKALQQQDLELVMLDQALDQLGECKGECQGEGKAGKNQKIGMNKFAKGGGRGAGERPIEEDKVGFRESHVSQNVGKGKAVITGEVDGPNLKGAVQQEIRAQLEAAKVESAESVSAQRIPRKQRDHAQEYFDSLREGK